VGSPITTSGGALRIGGNSIRGEYFRGLIDDVRIYNRALSAAEIQADMATPVR
jgi:concanavalin A-like lectin/glucanase superfamily protein